MWNVGRSLLAPFQVVRTGGVTTTVAHKPSRAAHWRTLVVLGAGQHSWCDRVCAQHEPSPRAADLPFPRPLFPFISWFSESDCRVDISRGYIVALFPDSSVLRRWAAGDSSRSQYVLPWRTHMHPSSTHHYFPQPTTQGLHNKLTWVNLRNILHEHRATLSGRKPCSG